MWDASALSLSPCLTRGFTFASLEFCPFFLLVLLASKSPPHETSLLQDKHREAREIHAQHFQNSVKHEQVYADGQRQHHTRSDVRCELLQGLPFCFIYMFFSYAVYKYSK